MMRMLATGLAAALAAGFAVSAASAAPPPQCKKYAENAVWSYEQNLRYNCGYGGFRWHNRYEWHYNWCLTVSPYTVVDERAARTAQLDACRAARGG